MPVSPAKTASKKTSSPQAKARAAYHQVPTKTTADDPGRYSKTPHEYGDILITPNAKGQTKLGGALQRDLVYWIERHTWGNAKRPEYAKLSLTQLARLCGSDRRTVARAIADLQQSDEKNPAGRGIIEARDRSGCGPTVAKMYKLTPANWKKARYYEAKAAEAVNVDAELEAEDDANAELAAELAANEPESTVQPGKVSRPQTVAVSPSKGAPAVSIRVVYRSVDLPFPVAFKAHPGRNGRVQISCRATAPQFFANPSPPVLPVTVEPIELNTYRDWTSTFVLNFWGKALDESLLSQIVTAADGAPISVFERVVLQRFKKSHTGRNHSTGLLVELAKDAARAYRAEHTEAKRREAEEARQRPQYSAAELAAFEAEANHTPAPAAEKCHACKGTGEGKKKWANRNGEYKAWPTNCEPCNGTGRKVAV